MFRTFRISVYKCIRIHIFSHVDNQALELFAFIFTDKFIISSTILVVF
jgi:hypothetical protein